ncbi:MAG TPA: hypothetical protein VFD84_07885 [Candidatus Binatia bacterium]|nr:hypothetical protein [Candidatus Binatia bacterium]
MEAGRVGGRIAALAGVGVLGLALATTAVRLDREPAPRDGVRDLVYLPDAHLLRPLVLGHTNVLADLVWFRTISYFGEHYQRDHAYPWLARMCEVVTDLDPRAEHVYRFGGLMLPWEAGEVDAGIRLLEKGIRVFPDSWELRYDLGIVRYLFQRDHARAADDLRRAAALPGAPPMVAGVAAALETKRDDPATAIEILTRMRDEATSPETRAVFERSIADARVAWDLARLDALVATFRARTGRLPASLDQLVAAGLLRAVPPDPYGGAYEVDAATGRVRSSTGRTPRALAESPRARAIEAHGRAD